MKTKKGQVEDMFGDFIIAVILIIAAIMIISVKADSHQTDVSEIIASDKSSLRGIDLLTLLRMPVEHPFLDKHGSITFAEFFELVAKNYPEISLEAGWLMDGNLVEDEIGVSDKIVCLSELRELFSKRLGYSRWHFKAYDKESMEMIFECNNIGLLYYPEGEVTYVNTTIPLSQPGKNIIIEMEAVA